MLTSLNAYSFFQRTAAPVQVDVESRTSDSSVKAEVSYWRENIGSIRTLGQFLEDERLFRFAKTAFGFASDENPDSVLTLAFQGGASAKDAFANRTPDYRVEDMVRSFGLAEYGAARLRDQNFIENIVGRYLTKAEAQTASSLTASVISTDQAKADYFKQRIAQIETPAELVADIGLYSFTMTAFGLRDRLGESALIQQVLTDGVGDDNDLANTLNDPRLYDLANAFGFGDVGTARVEDERFANSVVERYNRVKGLSGNGPGKNESADSAYFREAIASVTSVDDLVDDYKLYNYIMTAFDLSSEVDKKGIVRAVLNEGLVDEETLGNRLSDPRFSDMALTLGMKEFGTRNLRDPSVIDLIVNRFERVSREVEAGQENPSVEIAAYFDRKASTLSSWLYVAADSRLRTMAMTTLGMPQVMNVLDTDKLIAEFEKRYDIADLQDPEKREDFIKRFLILSDTGTTSTGGLSAAGVALNLLSSASAANADQNGGLYNLVARL